MASTESNEIFGPLHYVPRSMRGLLVLNDYGRQRTEDNWWVGTWGDERRMASDVLDQTSKQTTKEEDLALLFNIENMQRRIADIDAKIQKEKVALAMSRARLHSPFVSLPGNEQAQRRLLELVLERNELQGILDANIHQARAAYPERAVLLDFGNLLQAYLAELQKLEDKINQMQTAVVVEQGSKEVLHAELNNIATEYATRREALQQLLVEYEVDVDVPANLLRAEREAEAKRVELDEQIDQLNEIDSVEDLAQQLYEIDNNGYRIGTVMIEDVEKFTASVSAHTAEERDALRTNLNQSFEEWEGRRRAISDKVDLFPPQERLDVNARLAELKIGTGTFFLPEFEDQLQSLPVLYNQAADQLDAYVPEPGTEDQQFARGDALIAEANEIQNMFAENAEEDPNTGELLFNTFEAYQATLLRADQFEAQYKTYTSTMPRAYGEQLAQQMNVITGQYIVINDSRLRATLKLIRRELVKLRGGFIGESAEFAENVEKLRVNYFNLFRDKNKDEISVLREGEPQPMTVITAFEYYNEREATLREEAERLREKYKGAIQLFNDNDMNKSVNEFQANLDSIDSGLFRNSKQLAQRAYTGAGGVLASASAFFSSGKKILNIYEAHAFSVRTLIRAAKSQYAINKRKAAASLFY